MSEAHRKLAAAIAEAFNGTPGPQNREVRVTKDSLAARLGWTREELDLVWSTLPKKFNADKPSPEKS